MLPVLGIDGHALLVTLFVLAWKLLHRDPPTPPPAAPTAPAGPPVTLGF